MKYFIGIDIGTTRTKTAIFNQEGGMLASAYEESRLFYPEPGLVEQNADDFYTSSCNTIRRVIQESGVNAKDIAAISIDGQMAGILGIDDKWEAVTHYDSWLDSRCFKYVEYIKSHYEDKVLALSGLPSTIAHCPKILWWLKERPESFQQVRKFVVPAAFVAGRFAGLSAKDAFIDHTHLHFTGLYDAKTTQWSEELCEIFGIPQEKLPRIVDPWTIIGAVTGKASRDSGLATGTPIAAGAGDMAVCCLGAGLTEEGQIVDVAGTASLLSCCVGEYKPDLQYKTLLFPKAVTKGLWFPHAYIAGGGLCLRWFRDSIIKPDEHLMQEVYAVMDKASATVPAGSDGLMFIPHFGGRNYPYNSIVRGVWAGLSWNHERKHLYRSILESIAYEYYYYLKIEKSLFPDINLQEVRVIGGGAKSEIFNRIKADVLGLPYAEVNVDEVGVLGSAIIAGYSVGIIKNMESAAKSFVNIKNKIEPDLVKHEYYRNYAELYIDMFDILQPLYKKISHLSALTKP